MAQDSKRPDGKRNLRIARIIVDALLAVLFIALMATALVREAPHEYLGIATFACAVAHVVLNRRWFAALARGRWNAVRVLQMLTALGVGLCILGQMASSLILSKYAFGFLPEFPGAGWARRVHMLCSFWGFMLAFAHMGLQFRGFARLVQPKGGSLPAAGIWTVRIALLAVCCLGAYEFVQLNLGVYLLGRVQFAFADYETPFLLLYGRYASVAMLVACVSACLRRVLGGAKTTTDGLKGN